MGQIRAAVVRSRGPVVVHLERAGPDDVTIDGLKAFRDRDWVANLLETPDCALLADSEGTLELDDKCPPASEDRGS